MNAKVAKGEKSPAFAPFVPFAGQKGDRIWMRPHGARNFRAC